MSTPKSVIEAAGLIYLGPQETRTGPPGHLFNATTGSTLMMTGEITAESVAKKVQEHEQAYTSLIISKLAQIIKGQREEAMLPEETEFYDIFCANCEAQETDRSSLEAFAKKVYALGWHVLSVERNQAECLTCQDVEPDEGNYAAQYRIGNGGLI